MTTEHEPPNKKSKGRKGEEKIPAGKNGLWKNITLKLN